MSRQSPVSTGQGTWTGSVDFTLKIWDAGFCAHLQLVNPAPIASTAWSLAITLPASTTLASSWSGTYTQDATNPLLYTATPASWNGNIVSGSSKNTGFCVSFPTGSATPAAPVFLLTMSGDASAAVPTAAVTATPAVATIISEPTVVPVVTTVPVAVVPAPTNPAAAAPASTTTTPAVVPVSGTGSTTSSGTDATLAKAAAGELLVGYWGQVTDATETTAQQAISAFCEGPYDVINIAFANVFRNAENTIDLNLAANCDGTFTDSTILDCPAVGTAIAQCQALGKKVLISLGGGIASVGFSDAADITRFTNALWNMFLGGTDTTYDRPFGSVVLDGFDLDVEGGSDYGYDVFMEQIQVLMNGGTKKYYATAAPQCFFPDVLQNTAYAKGYFDWLNIQWYNNVCGNMNFPTSSWSDAVAYWYNWANTVSVNPDVRLLIGAPASTTSASAESYVGVTTPVSGETATMSAIIASWRANEASRFGGVMLWEVVAALSNSNYAQQIRTVLGG
ncbi:Chitinase 1 [Thoreauomyces humboldtii]|nr:Chitinase 1 [Thoreauomyces humboldtii]